MNEPIELGVTTVRFEHKGEIYQEEARAIIECVPRDRLSFKCSLEGKSPIVGFKLLLSDAWAGQLTLTDRGIDIDAFCSAVGEKYGGIVLSPTRSNISVTRPVGSIAKATFHVFNFPAFAGSDDYVLLSGKPPREGFEVFGRVVLRADGWIITIASTDRTKTLIEELKACGGFAITHVGEITREDGAAFSSDSVEDILTCLHYFLSFALGRWSGISLSVGWDADGQRVFEEWGMRQTADGAWKGSTSWFDLQHSELLSQVFPGFRCLWTNSLWRTPLTHALYWYLGACDRRVGIGVDSGLILAQTALELLAWTHCVLDRSLVGRRKFKPGRLNAAAKLRLLMIDLSIPVTIPAGLNVLKTAATGKVDGLDAITSVRNSLVHPDARPVAPGSYYEAWVLSLWYLDVVLLRLCRHTGKYGNRVGRERAGQLDQMP